MSGRPRDVDGSGRYWLDHADGSVTLVVNRRVGGPEGNWRELRFRAATEAAALAAYVAYCAEGYARALAGAARRRRWGPEELR
ncbi:MAG TPA: hypothetical protein VGJ25_10080 [Gaiellaceae bacterium]